MTDTTMTESATQMQQAVEQAVGTAQRWTDASADYSDGPTAKLLADVLEDPKGLDFTVEFVDGVIRPEDLTVAAQNLQRLLAESPDFLPAWLRLPAQAGGNLAKLAPETVVKLARRVFSELVGDLVLEVTDKKLGPAIAKLKKTGARLNINLLGEAVLGDQEAQRRLEETFKLLRRDDVDYVSLKASSVLGPHSDWSLDEVVDEAYDLLLPFYEYAAASPTPKFINLDMEEYRDVELTLDVFQKLMENRDLDDLEMGIVIQAYLPDALPAMERVQDWAAARRERGGAPIKVRLVKGANLAMERVHSEMNDWPLVTWESKQATDANYLRILDWALTPERARNVHIGVAGHNLFSLATAWELAGLRGVRDEIDLEMLSGMASSQAQAITDEVGDLLYYVPVVKPDEFDVAIAYLVRRLEENSDSANFMSSIFDLAEDQSVFDKEKERFMAAYQQMLDEGDDRCVPNRTQDRNTETREQVEARFRDADGNWTFRNEPNSDPALAANQEWARAIAGRIPTSELGQKVAEENTVTTEAELDERISKALAAGDKWRELSGKDRAELLHRVAVEVALRRGDLMEVAASELGKTLDQADVEVSEAVDFANYYAEQAIALENIPGAEFTPGKLTAITPPWNFPIAIPLGGVMSALAAGTAVLFKPASSASRVGALLAEIVWEAGIDKDLMQLVLLSDRELGYELITDPRVDTAVLTGASQTAEMFLNWRPDLHLLGETSGKNAIIVTESADLDLAVKDVVASAFGHSGQKCSAASLVILVGSVGWSERFRRQLLDAAESLVVAWPDDLTSEVSPLSVEVGDKLEQGLTELDPGQRWALRPEQLDATARVWSPGIRSHVQLGDRYHQIEYFGPILGVMRAATLEEALEMQNGVDFGLTGGIHSLDPEEIEYWLDRVRVGNAYINRTITGAIVQRQPFGGWKLSQVGTSSKAGGPNYLFSFGTMQPAETDPQVVASTVLTKPALASLANLAGELLDTEGAEEVRTATANAQVAADTHFDRLNDPSALAPERNILRYLPTDSMIRMAGDVNLRELMQVMAAAVAVGEFVDVGPDQPLVRMAPGQSEITASLNPVITVSTTAPVPAEVVAWGERYGLLFYVEDDAQFVSRLNRTDLDYDGRLRLIGAPRTSLGDDLAGSLSLGVWEGPVTSAARVEILPFVHEQAVSLTTHRFGTPSTMVADVLAEGAL